MGRLRRSWDDGLQVAVSKFLDARGEGQGPWPELAEDRDTWKQAEAVFVTAIARRALRDTLPSGRLLMPFEDDEQGVSWGVGNSGAWSKQSGIDEVCTAAACEQN